MHQGNLGCYKLLEGVTAMVRVLKDGGIGPNLGLGHSTSGVEDASHFPLKASELNFVSHFETGKFLRGTAAHDDFILAPVEHFALDDFDVSDLKGSGFD